MIFLNLKKLIRTSALVSFFLLIGTTSSHAALSCDKLYGTEMFPGTPVRITEYDPLANTSSVLPLTLSGTTSAAALSPDGTLIVWQDRTSSQYRSYNVDTLVSNVGPLIPPDIYTRMAFTQSGTLFSMAVAGDDYEIINPTTLSVLSSGSMTDAPGNLFSISGSIGGDIVFSGDGFGYLIDNNGLFFRFDPTTLVATYLTTFTSIAGTGPAGLALAPDGRIFTFSMLSTSVYEVDLTNLSVTLIHSPTFVHGDAFSCAAPNLTDILCGNGTVEGGEACDDGNTINTDACTDACTLPICGDGIVNGTDQCDDANVSNTDACTNACLFTVDLSLSKTASSPTPTIGTNVTFTITVTNNSASGTATGVTVADALPSGYSFVSSTPSQGTYTDPTWTIGTLTPLQTATLNIVATVLPTGNYTNFAQVMTSSGTDTDSTPGNDTDNTPNEDDEASVTTVPVPAAICGDGIVNGTDQCDDGNAVNTDACTDACTLPICGDGIVNGTDQCDDANVSNTDACTNACLFTVDLSLSKTASSPTPTIGTNVTFTITVTNNSASGTATGVTVADALPSGYSFVSSTPSQGTYTDPTWTIGTLTPLQTATLNIVATVLPTGNYTNFAQVMTSSGTDTDSTPGNDTDNTPNEDDEASVTTVPVPAAICGDGIVNGTDQCDDGNAVNTDACTDACTLPICGDGIVNGTDQCDDANVSNTDACTNACLFTVDLSLSKTASSPTPTIGTNVTFTITVTNNSASGTATGVTVADALPSGYSFVSSTPSQGTYTDPTWTIGTLTPLQTATLNIVATVLPTGNYTNFAQVMTSSGTDTDSTPGNDVGNTPDEDDEASVTTVPVPAAICGDGIVNGTDQCDDGNAVNTDACTDACTLPICGDGIVNGTDQCDDANVSNTDACTNACLFTVDLSLSKTASSPTPTIGTNVTFTITVTNNSASGTATGVTVADALPSGYSFVSSTPSQGTYTDPTWTIGTLTPLQTATLNIVATVLPTGNYTNFAQVMTSSGTDTDSTPGNDVGNTPDEDDEASVTTVPVPAAICGDGIVNGTDQCDDGNAVNTDACTDACTLPICGDGIVNGTDQCDDANVSNTDACTNACLFTVDLSLSKTASSPTPTIGTNVTFTITVTNNSASGTATGVTVADALPSGYSFVSSTPSQGTYTDPTWTIGTLTPLQTATLNIVATVLPTGNYTNFAQVMTSSGTDTDSTPGNDVGNTPDEDDEASVTTVPVPAAICGDGIVNGTDQCDDGNAVNTDACTDACTLPICGDGIVNGTDQCDDANVSNTDACTNACLFTVDLSLSKTASSPTPTIGTNVTFTITVTNNSASGTATGVTVADALPSGYSFVSSTPSQGTYTDPTWTIGTLTPLQTATLNIVATVLPTGNYTNFAQVMTSSGTDTDSTPGNDVGNTPDEDDEASVTTVPTAVCGDGVVNGTDQCDDANVSNTDACTNACTLAICGDSFIQPGETCDDGNTINTDTCSNACTPTIDLSLTKSVDNTTPTVGDVITFTLSLSNTGTGPATGVVVRDILPSGYTLGVATPSQGTFLAPDWTVGNVAAGQTVTMTITATVLPTGNYTNFAQIFTATGVDVNSTPGNDVGNTSDENDEASSTPSIQIADPGITKTVDNQNPDLNGIISYFITVTNNGPSTATNVVVTDILPPGLTLQTANVTAGAITLPTWTLATLAPLATETLTITARVDTANPITNSATLTSPTFDPNPGNNQADVTITPRTGIVRGHLFWDDNRNQSQDPGDQNLSNISLRITDSRGTFVVVTDANGNYSAQVAPGMVNVTVDDNDPDLPEDYVITVGQFNRAVNVLGGQDLAIHHLGIDDEEHNPGQEDKDKDTKKDRKKRLITATIQRTLVKTGIPIEAGVALGYISLLGITGLNMRRTKRW
jgi:uncharacterized repeat protein (TIGR01451 family)